MTTHDIFHELGRTAVAMGIGRRFGRGPRFHGHFGGAEVWGWAWPGDRQARRGDVKFEILTVLAEQPRHGYDVIRELETRRGGHRPSAGSVYPTLQMLEDEGCVTSETVDGKRVYTITEAGRKLLEGRPDDGPEADDEPSDQRRELRNAALKLGGALLQAAREGDTATLKHACEILDAARREIYALLGSSR
jgi:DNA-binding PadR family transcriptional regulator